MEVSQKIGHSLLDAAISFGGLFTFFTWLGDFNKELVGLSAFLTIILWFYKAAKKIYFYYKFRGKHGNQKK